MKSLEREIGPCSLGSCTQLCFVSDLLCKLPLGPLGAAAGEACQAAGNLSIVLGLIPRNPGPAGRLCSNSRASISHL